MNDIESMRKTLDRIDSELMRLYDERMELSKRIGEYKRTQSLPVEDVLREAEVLASRIEEINEQNRSGGERLIRLLMEESKRVQREGLNLYLIGMPDCGKTRTGKKLANLLGLPLADTDKLVELNSDLSIDGIFAEYGEERFRELESAVLRAVASRGGLIVATGGGLPLWGSNSEIMHATGCTVFLDRKLEKLHGQRTSGRPLIAAPTPEEVDAKIDRLYSERHDKYSECADLTVDPDEEGAAERIAQAYSRWLKDGIL